MINLMSLTSGPTIDVFVDEAVRLSGGSIRTVLHLGDKTSDYRFSTLTRMNVRPGRRGHLMENARYSGAADVLFRNPAFREAMELFVDHMHRTDPSFRFRSHNLRHVQDYWDYFYILSDTLAAQMAAQDVTHVFFPNIPHLAYDTVVYFVAKAMGLPTIMFGPSYFNNRFVSLTDPKHHGLFPLQAGLADTPAPYPFNREGEQEYFYMKGVKQERGATGTTTWKARVSVLEHLLRHAPGKLVNPVYLSKVMRRVGDIHGGLPDWRDPFAAFFHTNELDYFEHILQFEQGEVDFTRRFVYVPLHMQPEMTTSMLGGVYRDQALMIEHLSDILPDDVWIYVKENPKQMAWGRGPMFFHRLKRIPRVVMVPSFTSTHALRDASDCVATVTGTPGWEALSRGKPVIAFGYPEYRMLPGVTEFRPDLDYADVLANVPTPDALDPAAGALRSRVHTGVIDRHYRQTVPDFDEARNTAAIGRLIADLLTGEQETAFTAG